MTALQHANHQHANLQHDRITTLAMELRLLALPDLYGPLAQTAATRKDASYADFLEQVLRAERDARHIRSREILTRMAGFPALKTLEAYDFAFATGAPRQQIQELASLAFVERTENIVMLGPSECDSYCSSLDLLIIPTLFAASLTSARSRSLDRMTQGAPLQCCWTGSVPSSMRRRTVDALTCSTAAVSSRVASPRSARSPSRYGSLI
jgi:IstB-like ATP binding protein